MTEPSLRVYPSSNNTSGRIDRRQLELDRIAGTAEPKTVSVPLGEIVPLLIDAVSNDRAWLQDFAEDTIRVHSDLYDVLLAYQQLRNRPAA